MILYINGKCVAEYYHSLTFAKCGKLRSSAPDTTGLRPVTALTAVLESQDSSSAEKCLSLLSTAPVLLAAVVQSYARSARPLLTTRIKLTNAKFLLDHVSYDQHDCQELILPVNLNEISSTGLFLGQSHQL